MFTYYGASNSTPYGSDFVLKVEHLQSASEKTAKLAVAPSKSEGHFKTVQICPDYTYMEMYMLYGTGTFYRIHCCHGDGAANVVDRLQPHRTLLKQIGMCQSG